MLHISLALLLFAIFSFYTGFQQLKKARVKSDDSRQLFGWFCLLTGSYQLFQCLLYRTREVEIAFILVLLSYFAFLFSQLGIVYFIHWFTKKTFPRWLTMLCLLAVVGLSVMTLVAPFLTPLSENLFLRPAFMPGLQGTIFYDFELGIIFNLDSALAIIFNGIIFFPLLWYCRKSGRGFFSRLPFLQFCLLIVLCHDFMTANAFFESTYLYEFAVIIYILAYKKELDREPHGVIAESLKSISSEQELNDVIA